MDFRTLYERANCGGGNVELVEEFLAGLGAADAQAGATRAKAVESFLRALGMTPQRLVDELDQKLAALRNSGRDDPELFASVEARLETLRGLFVESGPSRAEQAACRDAALFLDTNENDSQSYHPLLTALEYFLPEILSKYHPEWRNESLDGILTEFMRRTGPDIIEIIGHAIVLGDQKHVAIHAELELVSDRSAFRRIRCKLGPRGRRYPSVADMLEQIEWDYAVEHE